MTTSSRARVHYCSLSARRSHLDPVYLRMHSLNRSFRCVLIPDPSPLLVSRSSDQTSRYTEQADKQTGRKVGKKEKKDLLLLPNPLPNLVEPETHHAKHGHQQDRGPEATRRQISLSYKRTLAFPYLLSHCRIFPSSSCSHPLGHSPSLAPCTCPIPRASCQLHDVMPCPSLPYRGIVTSRVPPLQKSLDHDAHPHPHPHPPFSILPPPSPSPQPPLSPKSSLRKLKREQTHLILHRRVAPLRRQILRHDVSSLPFLSSFLLLLSSSLYLPLLLLFFSPLLLWHDSTRAGSANEIPRSVSALALGSE